MMSDNQTYPIKLYPNVIPVKGYNRSMLLDLQNGKPYLVPNDLVDYLEQTPETACEEYDRFLLENELGVRIDEEFGRQLTPMPLDYYPESRISSAILELDEHSAWNLGSVLTRLNELGARFLEVCFLDYPSLLTHLDTLRTNTQDTTIEFIQILVPFNTNLKHLLDKALSEPFLRLSTIIVYGASSGFELQHARYNLLFSSQESVSHAYCGNISPDYFTLHTQAYVRNRRFNSCLAHKISVDKDGFICNCPSHNQKYAHADSVTLSEVIALEEFRELWKVTKDQVLVCSVCEFRWICSDCRAFTIRDAENGKPSKCTYNPFISLWADEEHYLPEEACGIRFSDNGIQLDEDKLNQLNTRIWH